MKVGDSIKKLRESHDLTQEELGKIAGVSAMAVSQWENGRAVPRMGSIQSMSDYFGIPKSAIMGDRTDYYAFTLDESKAAEPLGDVRELIDLYGSMTDEGRRELMDYARYIAGRYAKNQADMAAS